MYRLRDIEEWLENTGVKAKIARARTPNLPVDHVTLIPRGGRGLQTEGAITVAGLQVQARAQSFDKAEALAYQIDEIIVPFNDNYFPIWIGDEDHMTQIKSTWRAGGEPGVMRIEDAHITFVATYMIQAIRESRPLSQARQLGGFGA